jgi:AbiU2
MQLMLGPHPMIKTIPDMPANLRAGIEELSRATQHFLLVEHRYEMFQALARDATFVARINATSVEASLSTIRGALASSLVTSLAALFDRNRDATSLARVLKAVLAPANVSTFAALHPTFANLIDASSVRDALGRLCSRLSGERVNGAIGRLRDLRNQDVAHLDVDPAFPKGRALIGDIELVHAVSANIIVKANRFCGVHVYTSDVRENARSQAHALCQAIQPAGIEGS